MRNTDNARYRNRAKVVIFFRFYSRKMGLINLTLPTQ